MAADAAGAGVDGQGNGVVMMNEGDVLQVITGNGGDETGAIVGVVTSGGHSPCLKAGIA